jgi:hypothetical protein
MDARQAEFIRLIDHALAIAEQTKRESQVEQLDHLISALQTIKAQVIAGQLETSQGISTLGLARGVADWVNSLDSPLLKAVGAIEQYYQRHYA